MTLHIELMLPAEGAAGLLFSLIDTFTVANRLEASRSRSHEETAGRPIIRWRMIDSQGKSIAPGHPLLAGYRANDGEDERNGGRDDGYRGAHRGGHDSDVACTPGRRSALVVAPMQPGSLPHLRRIVAGQPEVLAWLARRHAADAMIATCGNGVWWLAAAGVLAGRSVAVPWTHQAWFAREFPDVRLAPGQAIVSDGPILCATTAAQQVGLAIRLLAALGATDLAALVANALLFDAEREQAMTDIADQGIVAHAPDSLLYKAIQWMKGHLDQSITLDDVARATSTSTRTLLRHFDKQLCQSPADYLARLRIRRAELLLQITLKDIGEIAQDCGYSDLRAFRKAFRRINGDSPSEYRGRFGMRGDRKRWRVDEALAGEVEAEQSSAD